jgi:hypothetical protein
MIISAKRQYQHNRFYSRTGRCHPEFCDEPVDQTSRDPKLASSSLTVTASASVTSGRSVKGCIIAHALARVPNPRRRQIAIGKGWPDGHTVTVELGPQKWYRSLRFKCNGLLHLNRGLPGSTVYDLSTVRQPEVRGEISPRIECSSLGFKCNRLLYLNRGLPGSAVYDLSTDRHQ